MSGLKDGYCRLLDLRERERERTGWNKLSKGASGGKRLSSCLRINQKVQVVGGDCCSSYGNQTPSFKIVQNCQLRKLLEEA